MADWRADVFCALPIYFLFRISNLFITDILFRIYAPGYFGGKNAGCNSC